MMVEDDDQKLLDDLEDLGFNEKPNCYKCIHRKQIGWSAHSKCTALQTIRGIETLNPEMINDLIISGKVKVPGVKFHQHGISNGWANWPSNFDPVWLEECRFYERK